MKFNKSKYKITRVWNLICKFINVFSLTFNPIDNCPTCIMYEQMLINNKTKIQFLTVVGMMKLSGHVIDTCNIVML